MDREKIIKGVECHRKKIQTTNAVSCLECPYAEPNPTREWCMSGLMDDIYALLKEQEAVTPKSKVRHGAKGDQAHRSADCRLQGDRFGLDQPDGWHRETDHRTAGRSWERGRIGLRKRIP